MKQEPKPILVKRQVKHTFDPAEIAQLNVEFGQAYDALQTIEAEFASVKASYKAKLEEAGSRMVTLRATINAGFDLRLTELEVIFRPSDKKKDFFTIPKSDAEPSALVLSEDMSPEDFQQDLIQAESIFSKRKELTLWAAGDDHGILIVGQLGGKWYSALRGNVGTVKLEERLDSEQKAYRTRISAITIAADRALKWLEETFGPETCKGFLEGINNVLKAEADKVE